MELNHEDELKRQKRFAKLDEVDPEFRENAQKLNEHALEELLTEVAVLEQANQDVLKNDEKVKALKEELSGLLAPYRETTKVNKIKMEFLVWVGNQKGFNKGA